MLACKICLVSLVVASMLATTKSKNDADNKRNIGADIESSNVKPSSPIAPLANSSKPAIFNMMKGFMNTSAKGIYSYNRKLLPYNKIPFNLFCNWYKHIFYIRWSETPRKIFFNWPKSSLLGWSFWEASAWSTFMPRRWTLARAWEI